MDNATLKEFFFWCMIVNIAIFSLSTVVILALHGFIEKLQAWMFRLEEADVRRILYGFLGGYKLLIIVFNIVPWVALMILE